jgi:hypothetical protein
MTYRDDRDADRARVEALEGELAAAQRKIAELEGHREQALVLASAGPLAQRRPGAVARWFGAPLTLALTRRFDGAYPTDRLEDLLENIRSFRHDRGLAEVLRSSLTWHATWRAGRSGAPPMTLSVVVKDGATTLIVQDRLHQLAGGIYGGVGGGVGGGAIVLPMMLAIAHPIFAPLIALGWFGGVFTCARALFKRLAKRQAQSAQQLFDYVAAELEAGIREGSR